MALTITEWSWFSGTDHFLHDIARHRVDEESQDEGEQGEDEQLDEEPLVLHAQQLVQHPERVKQAQHVQVRPATGVHTRAQPSTMSATSQKQTEPSTKCTHNNSADAQMTTHINNTYTY